MASIANLRDICDALTKIGLENGSLKTMISDLKKFFYTLSNNEELQNILITTAFEIEERKNIIADICDKLGTLKETKNFLILSCELDKFGAMLNKKDSIIRKFEQAAGELKVEITSSKPLTENEISKIRRALSGANTRDVEINVKVDASIIGGMITKIENKVYDNSIKTRLNTIKSVLTL